MADYGPKSRV